MDQNEGHFQIAQPAAHTAAQRADRPEITGLERRLLEELLAVCGDPPIAFSLWTGEQVTGRMICGQRRIGQNI